MNMDAYRYLTDHYDEKIETINRLAAGNIGCPERTAGTITETAFDVVSVKGDTMYLTRFGAGADRRVDLLRASQSNYNRTYFRP